MILFKHRFYIFIKLLLRKVTNISKNLTIHISMYTVTSEYNKISILSNVTNVLHTFRNIVDIAGDRRGRHVSKGNLEKLSH